jgi:hypothetical protein
MSFPPLPALRVPLYEDQNLIHCLAVTGIWLSNRQLTLVMKCMLGTYAILTAILSAVIGESLHRHSFHGAWHFVLVSKKSLVEAVSSIDKASRTYIREPHIIYLHIVRATKIIL